MPGERLGGTFDVLGERRRHVRLAFLRQLDARLAGAVLLDAVVGERHRERVSGRAPARTNRIACFHGVERRSVRRDPQALTIRRSR